MANEEQRISILNEAGDQAMTLFQQAVAYAQSFSVVDKASFEQAFADIRSANSALKKLEEQAAEITGPLRLVIDRVEAALAPKREAVKYFVALMKGKTVQFEADSSRRALEAQQQAQMIISQGAIIPLEQQRAAIQQIDDARPSAPEGVSFVSYAHYEVIDEALLPEQFTKRVVDKAACNAYAKEHKGDPAKSLPGLRLYATKSPTVRS